MVDVDYDGIMYDTDDERYLYYTPHRPPAPGTIPRDGLLDVFAYETRRGITEHGIMAWGHVVYERQLTDEEISDYELFFGGKHKKTRASHGARVLTSLNAPYFRFRRRSAQIDVQNNIGPKTQNRRQKRYAVFSVQTRRNHYHKTYYHRFTTDGPLDALETADFFDVG